MFIYWFYHRKTHAGDKLGFQAMAASGNQPADLHVVLTLELCSELVNVYQLTLLASTKSVSHGAGSSAVSFQDLGRYLQMALMIDPELSLQRTWTWVGISRWLSWSSQSCHYSAHGLGSVSPDGSHDRPRTVATAHMEVFAVHACWLTLLCRVSFVVLAWVNQFLFARSMIHIWHDCGNYPIHLPIQYYACSWDY